MKTKQWKSTKGLFLICVILIKSLSRLEAHHTDLEITSVGMTHHSLCDTALTCFQYGAPNERFTSEMGQNTVPLWMECGARRPNRMGQSERAAVADTFQQGWLIGVSRERAELVFTTWSTYSVQIEQIDTTTEKANFSQSANWKEWIGILQGRVQSRLWQPAFIR